MKQKHYLLLLISAAILVIAWVVFNIYHNFTTSTIDENLTQNVVPIQGSFDQDTINELKNRKRVEVNLEAQSQIASEAPSLSPSPTPKVASSSSKISPTKTPTR